MYHPYLLFPLYLLLAVIAFRAWWFEVLTWSVDHCFLANTVDGPLSISPTSAVLHVILVILVTFCSFGAFFCYQERTRLAWYYRLLGCLLAFIHVAIGVNTYLIYDLFKQIKDKLNREKQQLMLYQQQQHLCQQQITRTPQPSLRSLSRPNSTASSPVLLLLRLHHLPLLLPHQLLRRNLIVIVLVIVNYLIYISVSGRYSLVSSYILVSLY